MDSSGSREGEVARFYTHINEFFDVFLNVHHSIDFSKY